MDDTISKKPEIRISIVEGRRLERIAVSREKAAGHEKAAASG
jgi:hypothetical protein